MITEVRIYTMKPGRLDDFLSVFHTGIVPTSKAYGIRDSRRLAQRRQERAGVGPVLPGQSDA